MSTEFRPLRTRALHALELRNLNPVDTSWSAFNYYMEYGNESSSINYVVYLLNREKHFSSKLICFVFTIEECTFRAEASYFIEQVYHEIYT